jgi:hypothetical protein
LIEPHFDHPRIREFFSRIEHHTGHRPSIIQRPLERGPADDAGVTGFLISVSATCILALFFIPDNPDETIIRDILDHAHSAGVTAAFLFLSDMYQIYCHAEKKGEQAWILDLCHNNLETQEPVFQESSGRISELCSKLVSYLSDMRRELNGWFYRREGETSVNLRDITVQMVMHRVLLNRISLAHGIAREESPGNTLWDELYTFATSMPVHDQYDILILDIHDDETEQIIQRLASEPLSELADLRLSWIEPDTWAEIFGWHLLSLSKKYGNKADILEQPHQGGLVIPGETKIGQMIFKELEKEITRFFPGRIFDPVAGSGLLITRMLRIIRMKTSSSPGGTDTIISRLIVAGETIHATDVSTIHVATIRFVVVLWIISGELRDPCIRETPLWYPFMALNDHIRPGSILYGDDLPLEFISPQAGYSVMRLLHPLDPVHLSRNCGQFNLILTCPDGTTPLSVPEIQTYLTKKYQSFQKETSSAVLICERIRELIARDGAGIVLLPSCWLSDRSCTWFRKWMRHALPAGIILGDESAGRINLKELSAVIRRNGEEPVLRVIRLPKEDNADLARDYFIQSGNLPEDGGWRLDDPWEEKLLMSLKNDITPLSGYLLGELYPGNSGKGDIDSSEGWTSIICSDGDITVYHGDIAHPNAMSIIPGKDQYLIGLLHSSFIRWYADVTLRRYRKDGGEIMNWIRNLPIRTIDHYNDDECTIQAAIEKIVSRLFFLTRQLAASRAWHDRDRLGRQIAAAQEHLDMKVCSLYRISRPDCLEMRRRTRAARNYRKQTVGIHIFS